jgi:hypothetical protein
MEKRLWPGHLKMLPGSVFVQKEEDGRAAKITPSPEVGCLVRSRKRWSGHSKSCLEETYAVEIVYTGARSEINNKSGRFVFCNLGRDYSCQLDQFF